MKRLFDIFFSAIGLVILSPLLVTATFLIKLDSTGPVFYRHERIGRNFKPFKVYKFRTMIVGAEKQGPAITVGEDGRITKVGKFLRRYKIDEIPQLINVLKGEMSFVGPRPEVRDYVQLFKEDYKKLLTVRPGITDPASLKYAEEGKVLSLTANWEEEYRKKILPEKIRLSLHYVENRNMTTDLKLIFQSILRSIHAF
ncbi:MAG: sugar transferase [Nitrospirota bacterium]